MTEPKTKIPKTVGGIADRWYRIRAARLELEKKVKLLQKEESDLKEAGRVALKAQKQSRGTGQLGTISCDPVDVPTVTDWEMFYNHIAETNSFDLLQRRPAMTAFRDRWEEGEKIPGVERTPITKTSLTKAPAKSSRKAPRRR